MDNNLSLALSDSISDEAGAIANGLLEVGLDAIMDDGLLKEVPILSTAVSLYKIGNSIKERHQLKKLASFVVALNNGIADEEKREHYKNAVKDHPKRRDKELEYILILIDRYIHSDKAKMLSKLYLAYLDDIITWIDFTKYAEVIDRFLPDDYNVLKSAATYKTERDLETDSLQRLIALGLVIEGFRTIAVQEQNGAVEIDPPELREKNERNYTRTIFGNVLVEILGNE